MIVFCSPGTNYPKLTMIRVEAVILYATDMVSEVLIKLKRKIQLTSDWIKWMTLYWSYYFKALLMSFKTSWIVIREEQAPQPPLSQSHDFSSCLYYQITYFKNICFSAFIPQHGDPPGTQTGNTALKTNSSVNPIFPHAPLAELLL